MPNSLGLDPKHFKHVKSDEKSTTLEHKNGHLLTIQHNAISPKMRLALGALSKIAGQAQTEGQKQEAQDSSQYGKVIQKAEGGEVEQKTFLGVPVYGTGVSHPKAHEQSHSSGDDAPWPSPSQTSVGREVAAKRQANGYADGGEVSLEELNKKLANVSPTQPDLPQKEAPKPTDMDAEISKAGQDLKNYLTAPSGTPVEETLATQKSDVQPPQVPQQTQPSIPQMAEDAQQAQPQVDPLANAQTNQTALLQQGYQNKLAGIQQEAAAKGSLGEQQAEVLKKNEQAQINAQSAFKQHYDALEAERQAHMADIKNGYIDPNQYWNGDKNGNGGHSKIAAGIGMILAGFNPTTQPNAAINFLKYQMDQNLEAQKQNLGAKQNLLTANLRQFGNLKDATDMTRLMQSDIMQNELTQAASKAASPMAKAAALQAAGQLKMDYAPLQQNLAMRTAMMNMANKGSDPASMDHMLGYMRMVNPEMAKEMESRYVPGVGMASVPLPNDVRDKLQAHQTLDSAAKDLQQFAKTHTTIVPGTAAYNTGAQKALELQQMIRHGLLNTVYREGEQPLLDKMIKGNPANFLKNINTMPQIKELLRTNEVQSNILRKGYGLPAQQAAAPEPVKGKDGKMYIRQGQYMVPYKGK